MWSILCDFLRYTPFAAQPFTRRGWINILKKCRHHGLHNFNREGFWCLRFVTHIATAQCRDRITLAMKHGKGENPLDTAIGPVGKLIVSFALACTLPYTITTRTPYLPVRTYNICKYTLSFVCIPGAARIPFFNCKTIYFEEILY